MSISINIENISQEQREKIHSDLTIKIDPPSYSFGAKATYLYPYDISGDNVILPFSYAVGEGFKRPSRESFPTLLSTTFTATLRENQKQVRDEALQFLKKGI